jgi:hemoglobin
MDVVAVQHKKQKAFMSYAFGAPTKYTGLAMDVAHRKLVKEGMNDSHFDAIAGHLKATLEELKVSKDLVDEVITAVGGLREQVMCRGKVSFYHDQNKVIQLSQY